MIDMESLQLQKLEEILVEKSLSTFSELAPVITDMQVTGVKRD